MIKLDIKKGKEEEESALVIPIQREVNKSAGGFNAILEWGKSLKVKSNVSVVPALK